jgi:outer membrane lipoprotein SlyB
MNAAMSYPNTGSTEAAGFTPQGPSPTKPLWAVIGVLGMCVLALGASLVSIHKRTAEPVVPGTNLLRFAGPSNAFGLTAPRNGNNKVITETADGNSIDKPLQAQENNARPATKNIAKPQTAKTPAKTSAVTSPTGPTQGNTPAHHNAPVATGAQPSTPPPVLAQVPPVQAKPVCASCGTIEAVTPVTRAGKGSGVGMVAGGVLGAVLGNQVGGGNGRTAATVLGAVGGGWAGNAVEKNIKKDTVYSVRVRMEDGSSRTLEQASAPAVGSKVTVEGSTLRASSGEVYAPAPEQRARAPQTPPQRDVYNTGG